MKIIIHEFDHALVLNGNSPHKNMTILKDHFEKIIFADYQPTCENLVLDFSSKIQKYLPQKVKLFSVRLEETPSSFAEWFASDNLLPKNSMMKVM